MRFLLIASCLWLLLISIGCNNGEVEPEVVVFTGQEDVGFVHPYKETSALAIDLCGGEGGKGPVLPDTLDKYGKFNPFNFQLKERVDTMVISFDFIQTCCLEFYGYYQITTDSVCMYYGFIPKDENTFCDCDCEYRMQYSLPIDSVGQKKTGVKLIAI